STAARGSRPMSHQTTRGLSERAASVRKSIHHRAALRASARATRVRRQRASHRAACGGNCESGAPRASCVQRIASGDRGTRQRSSSSPRSKGRKRARSSRVRAPSAAHTSTTSLLASSSAGGWTTNASLQPHFTPSRGRPTGLSASDWPACSNRSNARRGRARVERERSALTPAIGVAIRSRHGDADVAPRRGADWRTFGDDERGIHRRVEDGECLRVVFDAPKIRIGGEQSPHTASGERAPEFAWHEHRQRAAGREELERSLDEQRGDVDLGGKAACRAGEHRARIPGRGPRDAEIAPVDLPLCGRDAVHAHPGRIADDKIESTARGDVGEVYAEGERQRTTGGDSPAKGSQLRGRAAKLIRGAPLDGGIPAPGPEQIAATSCDDQIAATLSHELELAVEHRDGARAFGALERSGERDLANAGCTTVSLAKMSERRRRAGVHVALGERPAGQRVTDADIAIEVGKRYDGGWIALGAFDDDGEPETKLREPHRGRVDVDAEDRAREHVATDGGEVASIAELNTQFGETLERVHE